MGLDKVTKINFLEGQETAHARGITQWDQGQYLEISGLNISNEIVEVHFSLDEYNGKAERMLGEVIDGVIHTKIPQFIMEGPEYCCGTSYNAYAWVYVSDEESAETIRKIELEITARSKPDEYVKPEELSFLQQLEAHINKKLDKSGHAPNMYLGTDENGNVVERENSGGVTDEQVESAVEKYLQENNISADIHMRVAEGYVQFSSDNETWENVIALSELKGEDGKDGLNGADGVDGYTPVKGVDYFDGKDGYTPQKGVDYFDGQDGAKGEKGDKGEAGAQGEKGDKGDVGAQGVAGKDGKDGVSVAKTEINSKGELVITLSDNTVSNLGVIIGAKGEKGDKGDTGEQGIQGVQGEKGDKGETGENGKDGSDASVTTENITKALGYTPANQEKVSQLSDEIADEVEAREQAIIDLKAQGIQQTPLFANSIEECTDTSKVYVLPDGYIYGYILTEKETSSGGYKNWLPLATETYNGTTVYGDKGYTTGNRLSSSGSVSAQSGMLATGFVPASDEAVIRTEGFTAKHATMGCYVITYNASGTKLKHYQWFGGGLDDEVTQGDAYISQFTLDSETYGTGIAFVRISASEVSSPAVITVNEKIEEGETTIVKDYAWASTGHAFVPADYEDRIIALEKAKNNVLGINEVFAPSPQLPADGSEGSDFNAETCTAEDIHDFFDTLLVKYPRYVTKEILGKDASGNHDWCRYTLCQSYYNAWRKENYPAMYAWVSGSTTIYSTSVSPRIGDTLYTTAYIGTTKGTVTATDHVNQTRTVGGVVYTRDKTKDIEPILVYTENAYSPYFVGGYAGYKNEVYNSSRAKISTIATYSNSEMTDANGISYVRYPFGDRNELFGDIPTIVIGSNEHGRIIKTNGTGGDPVEPSIISARMFKDLCECRNANNPFLNLLKTEYKVIFCIINPYGLSSTASNFVGYYNSNGVNIDRNFDTPGWGNDTTSGSQGDYAGSEIETQYFMNTLVESKAKIATANHGLGNEIDATTGEDNSAGHCHWMLGRDNDKYTDSLKSIGAIMSANYNLSFSDYGQAPPETKAKTRSYIDWIGAEGGAVEMTSREGFVLAGESNLHTARILEADYTLLLRFLHMLMVKQES